MARQWAGNDPEIKVSICEYMSGPEKAQKWLGNDPEMAQKWSRNGPEMVPKWPGNVPENGYKTPSKTTQIKELLAPHFF